MSAINYKKMLEESFVKERECAPPKHILTKLEFLSCDVFEFTTYCSTYDELFATKALEVCEAVSKGTNFEYIKDETNHMWYLIMCNMPFFMNRLEWGTSVRGAWWEREQKLDASCLYLDGEQIGDILTLDRDEWVAFVDSMIEWVKE